MWMLLAMLVIGYAFVRTATVTEDAFITFRVIDNAIRGDGLVWNLGERVQPYTHPLWAMMLWAAGSITGELFHTALAMSLVLTLLTVALIARFSRTGTIALWAIIALLFSESFIEYSSAALENALAHALVAGLVIAWRFAPPDKAWIAALCGGLLVITRHDFAVLVAPALLALWWRVAEGASPLRSGASWRVALIAAAPLVLWSAFALIYYGSPWPNSAFAKLNNGLSLSESFHAAAPYFRDLAKHDAVTALVIVIAVLRGLGQGAWHMRPIALGIALYLLYLGSAGGDYMGGRLFSTPFVVAITLIAINVAPRWWLTAPLWFVVTIALGWQRGWMVRDVHPHSEARKMSQHAWMYPYSGWTAPERRADFSSMPWAQQGLAAKREGHSVVAKCAVGLFGYSAGREVYIVDPLAITDSFLSRLPAKKPSYPGHFERAFPKGYLETITSGTMQIADPHLATLYTLTQRVARDPLWSEARWQAIWALNTGAAKSLAARASYDPSATFAPGYAKGSNETLACMGQYDALFSVRLK
jgi:arabinofuranosyltransferase